MLVITGSARNLQKHLLARAGQWKEVTVEEELLQEPGRWRAKKETWHVSFDALADYSTQLFEVYYVFIMKFIFICLQICNKLYFALFFHLTCNYSFIIYSKLI